ncbi:uncharacterized protein J4E87_002678 [Alternaria ethzedia]|uniref:uncharacterized protein n=1 Tax=Alternaria ethzedia TaxID=181014 RepID=UPI0020C4629C|nr:uncharacterized protein J4E87_002678 [Alternaria ethzedia]KAI4631971.1 hypothetical protein J4E87_002678 [Alternaria ethzedia]
MTTPNLPPAWLVHVTTFLQSAEVQAKVARLRAETRELYAEIGRFAAINGPFIAAGGDPHKLPNPWYLTPARLDSILRLYYGLKPHDPSVAAISFGEYFGSVNEVANGVPIGIVVNEFTIYSRAANQDEVIQMIKCINDSESFGEGGTGLPVHSEEELKFNMIWKLTR